MDCRVGANSIFCVIGNDATGTMWEKKVNILLLVGSRRDAKDLARFVFSDDSAQSIGTIVLGYVRHCRVSACVFSVASSRMSAHSMRRSVILRCYKQVFRV